MDNRGSDAMGEPDQVRDLRTLADTVRETLADASRGPDGGDLRQLVGMRRILAELARLEPRARRSVWNMQPRIQFDPEDVGRTLTDDSRARGLDLALITRPATLDSHPLLPSLYPSTRVGPVFLRALIVDQARVLIEGLDTADGEVTAWVTGRKDLVVPALEVWERTLALSTPVLAPGEKPPLTRRQVEVARLLALGEKDQSIARQLDMSARTVERDVHVILAELGARSRAEAVLAMTGRGTGRGR